MKSIWYGKRVKTQSHKIEFPTLLPFFGGLFWAISYCAFSLSEVEVEESIGAVIIGDRRLEDNLSRKERYHCYSLEAADFEGMDYADGTTPEDDLMEQEFCRELQEVLEGLTDIQKQRVKSLPTALCSA